MAATVAQQQQVSLVAWVVPAVTGVPSGRRAQPERVLALQEQQALWVPLAMAVLAAPAVPVSRAALVLLALPVVTVALVERQ